MLHDIGKKFLPEEIANGKWPLEGAEREAGKSLRNLALNL